MPSFSLYPRLLASVCGLEHLIFWIMLVSVMEYNGMFNYNLLYHHGCVLADFLRLMVIFSCFLNCLHQLPELLLRITFATRERIMALEPTSIFVAQLLVH